MAKDAAHLHPGDGLAEFQDELAACDVIYLHADGGNDSGRFDLEGTTIQFHVRNGAHKRIIGVPREAKDHRHGGNAVARPILFSRPDRSQVKKGGGVFDILLEEGILEIDGLDLAHEFALRKDPQELTQGTSTLAVTIDNSLPSTFRLTNCGIHTFAATGVLIQSINSHSSTVAVRHDIAIRACTIRGDGSPGGPVNHSAVSLGGAFTGQRVELNGSRFEVSGCTLDPGLFAGVAVLHFDSDAASRFVIARNTIGGHLGASHGVWLGNEQPPSYPRGVVEIAHNLVTIGRAHPTLPSGAGILVQVGNEDPQQSLWTWIRDNDVHLQLLGQAASLDGILYEDLKDRVSSVSKGYRDPVAGMGSLNTSALVEHNKVYNSDVAQGRGAPVRAIRVGGRGSHVFVRDNDLLGLATSEAHVALGELACSNLVRGNAFGRVVGEKAAGVLCEGEGCLIVENDFRASGAPGWTLPSHSGGPGCVRLGPNSRGNHVAVGADDLPEGTTLGRQCWDDGHGNTVADAPCLLAHEELPGPTAPQVA